MPGQQASTPTSCTRKRATKKVTRDWADIIRQRTKSRLILSIDLHKYLGEHYDEQRLFTEFGLIALFTPNPGGTP